MAAELQAKISVLESKIRELEKQRWQQRNFDRFMNLPIEIRCMIWDLTLPGSRVIPIRQAPSGRDSIRCYRIPMSQAMRICKESRQRALNSFQPRVQTIQFNQPNASVILS